MGADPLVPPAVDELALLSYRRQVTDIYREVRRRGPSAESWAWWIEARDELFANHPASPFVAAGQPFDGLDYYPYDPTLHLGEVACIPARPFELTIGHSAGGTTPARRFATVELTIGGITSRVSVFWLDVYGGGVFLPLRDATNGVTTYGGGRYVLDTAKGADLGSRDGHLTLDLNFTFHPSCVHDPRWSCPLAPADERLESAVSGGERLHAAG
jgi:uncharacterized protein (DUF1684 family)